MGADTPDNVVNIIPGDPLVTRLGNQLRGVIDDSAYEHIPAAAIIGVLEIIKSDLIHNLM